MKYTIEAIMVKYPQRGLRPVRNTAQKIKNLGGEKNYKSEKHMTFHRVESMNNAGS